MGKKIRLVVLIILVECFPGFLLYSCYRFSYPYGMQEYYSDKANYIRVEGTVSHFRYTSHSKTKLYLAFDDVTDSRLEHKDFVMEGNNLTIAQEQGLDEKVTIGSRVSFVTAPKCFYDGCVLPIAALSIDGEDLLLFDEGFENLQQIYK